MVDLNRKFEEYTEEEFLQFVTNICDVNVESEATHRKWVWHFNEVTEHPSGSDLIYYPESDDSTPETIVRTVKEWRIANGKPGFKSG